jgi:two-component system, sensor histidine kinase RpfC
MRSMLKRLLSRFEGRPDSEHRQAFIRLGVAALLLICTLGAHSLLRLIELPLSVVLPVLLAEAILGLAIVVHIAWHPAVSLPRRWLGMLADSVTLGILLSLGSQTAPLYILLLGLSVDNGLRYGRRFLLGASGLTAVSFLCAILVSDYWRLNGPLSWALLSALLLIPACLMMLLRTVADANEAAHRARAAGRQQATDLGRELHVPLNAMLNVSELLSACKLDNSQREYANDLKASASALRSIIDDVLDVTRVEPAKLLNMPADFELAGLMRSVKLMVQPAAMEQGLDLDIRIDDAIPREIHGDAGLLRRILAHLIFHSIRCSERGQIGIEVALRPSVQHEGIPIRFLIRHSLSIAPKMPQPRSPQSFGQVDNDDSSRCGEASSGAAIARALAEFLGGSVVVESDACNGSQFRLDLDLSPAQESAAVTRPDVASRDDNVIAFADPFVRHRARVRSLDILIADDQPSSLSMLRRLLEKAGHRVCSAGSGEEVLMTIVERRFDAAIIDLHMPGVCGIETIQQARIMESGGDRTPIIVLSSDSNADAVHEAQRAGAHVYLTKPIMVPQLLDVIASVATWAPHAKQRPLRSGIDVFAEAQVSRQIIDEFRDLRLGEKFIRGFIDECLNDSAKCIDELEKCARAADWGLYRDHCHALKGVASNMGAIRLAQSASTWMMCANRELEKNWKSSIGELGIDLEYARGAIGTLLDDGNREAEPERS